MKLLFVTFDFPASCGGPVVNLSRLLPELVRRGHEIHASILSKIPFEASRTLEECGVSCRYFDPERLTTRTVRALLQHVQAVRPDMFIANSSVAAFYAARWVRAAGIPTIGCYRSDDVFHTQMLEQFVSREDAWAFSALVCVSHQLAANARRAGAPQTRIEVIPSGVPLPDECCEQDSEIRIGYAGRLEQEQKRILETVDALILAVNQGICARAALFGTGSKWEQVKTKLSRAGLTEKITLRGPIPPDAIQEELRAYNVITLLSDYEGTPGALMDGMANGLVPVTLNIPGGVSELVRHDDTGVIVADRGRAFLAALERLKLAKEERIRMGRNAQALIASAYSLPAAATAWERLFASLASTAPATARIRVPRPLRLPKSQPAFAREDGRLTLCRPVQIVRSRMQWMKRLANKNSARS